MERGKNINSGLISIIVPVYNGQDFIDRCVISIQAQTYSNWELLLMDGASDDNSPALCDKWSSADKRVRAFHSDHNRGVSEGRNMGLRQAQGDYIMFVDVDDWLMPDCLKRLYEDLQRSGVQIAGCKFIRCTDADWENQNRRAHEEAGGMMQSSRGPAANDCKEAELPAADISDKPYVRLIAGQDFLSEGILKQDTRCWSKLYKREIIEGRFFNEDYTIGEDMLFVWETAREAELISSSEYEGYCYYYNVNGAMLKRFRESDIDQIRCWQFLLDSLFSENKENEKYDTSVINKAASILLISCMLTVGKLAQLPMGERRQYADVKKKCRTVLCETLSIKGAYKELDKGYRLKVQFYKRFPGLYLVLYHILKR